MLNRGSCGSYYGTVWISVMVNWMKAAALKLQGVDMSQRSPARVWTPRGCAGLGDNSVKSCMSQRIERGKKRLIGSYAALLLRCFPVQFAGIPGKWVKSRCHCCCFDCEKCSTFSTVLEGTPKHWLPLDYRI